MSNNPSTDISNDANRILHRILSSTGKSQEVYFRDFKKCFQMSRASFTQCKKEESAILIHIIPYNTEIVIVHAKIYT